MISLSKRDLCLMLGGALLSSGFIFIATGLIYRGSFNDYIQANYFSPIFAVPKEVNRDFVIDIIDLSNIERKRVNLQPLKENSSLSYAAYLRARDILDNQDFSHIASVGGEIKAQKAIQVVSYRYSEAGENLAMGIDNPNEVVAQWIASPEHKTNLLNKSFSEIGVAVLNGKFQGTENMDIVVQLFGHN